ncbi:MAG: AIM24 family protein [Clostridia bacterium]|nr:AIM24 family protein [Clostridia bacterium]
MFQINNFTNNDDVTIIAEKGPFQVIQYKRDLSVSPSTAVTAYFCDKMNIRKRQVICNLSKSNGIICQAGAMQWSVGDVKATTGVKGATDFLGKFVKGKVTGESTIKPEYVGSGTLVLEPTYRHLVLLDTGNWNGKVVLDDGLFLACDASIKQKVVARSNISSAVLGGEGLFNLALEGVGIAVLECRCPQEELIEVTLENDVLKVDGSFAIAWSDSLSFTVERSNKTLIGSAASGEGFVNVYRGTGKVLLAPVDSTIGGFPFASSSPSAPASAGTKSAGLLGSFLGGVADALD